MLRAARATAASAAALLSDTSAKSQDSAPRVRDEDNGLLPAPPSQPCGEPGKHGERDVTVRWGLQPGEPEPEEFEIQYGFRMVGAWRRASIAKCVREADDTGDSPVWVAEMDDLEPGGR